MAKPLPTTIFAGQRKAQLATLSHSGLAYYAFRLECALAALQVRSLQHANELEDLVMASVDAATAYRPPHG